MAIEKRGEARDPGYARVMVEEAGAFGYLRDISRGGCKVAFPWPGKLLLGREYAFTVTFDAIPGFSTASFRGRTAWIKESRGSAIIGVELIELGGGPIDKEFLELLEYYRKKLP